MAQRSMEDDRGPRGGARPGISDHGERSVGRDRSSVHGARREQSVRRARRGIHLDHPDNQSDQQRRHCRVHVPRRPVDGEDARGELQALRDHHHGRCFVCVHQSGRVPNESDGPEGRRLWLHGLRQGWRSHHFDRGSGGTGPRPDSVQVLSSLRGLVSVEDSQHQHAAPAVADRVAADPDVVCRTRTRMKNITAVNNTLYKNDDGVFMRWGSSATNMILANNAIYSASKNALNLSGSVGTFTANYVEGKSDRALDGVAFIAGGSSSAAFVDPANNDFGPQIGSRLIGLANSAYTPPADFNTNSRRSPYDVGAYETDGSAFNPGWRITAGFKELAPPAADTIPPTIRITAPLPGTTVFKTQTLTISAEASDNVGVVGVRFWLDGTDLKPEDLTAPYSITLNMSKISEGTHTLTGVARDAAGNSTTSSPVSITVNKR